MPAPTMIAFMPVLCQAGPAAESARAVLG